MCYLVLCFTNNIIQSLRQSPGWGSPPLTSRLTQAAPFNLIYISIPFEQKVLQLRKLEINSPIVQMGK